MSTHNFVLTGKTVTDPLSTDATNATSPPHDEQHGWANAEVSAIGSYFTPNVDNAGHSPFFTGGGTNNPQLQSGSTGNPVALASVGGDTDIHIKIAPKGAGNVGINTTAPLSLFEVVDNTAGSNPHSIGVSPRSLSVKEARKQTGKE